MSRRDRNQPYYERYDEQDERPRSSPEWDRDPQRYRAQGQDWGQRNFDAEYEQQRYGSRNPDERDYSARYLGYEARYEPRESQRFPASFGSYDDQRRVRRFEDDSDYGRYGQGREDRDRWNEGSQSQSRYGSGSSYGGAYGSGRNLDVTGSQSYGQGSRSDFSSRYDYGRDAQSRYDYGRDAQSRDAQGRDAQSRYGQQGWGERADYNRDYERDAGRREEPRHGRERSHEGLGQQLREAGQEIARKVKRAFRGPKGYKRSDERIREDVNDRLSQQDSFDPSDIEVSVANAEVTLTGSVRSRHEKFLAEEIADDVSGVSEVHNQLRVRREQAVNLTEGAPGTSTTGTGATWNQGTSATGTAGTTGTTGTTTNRNAHS